MIRRILIFLFAFGIATVGAQNASVKEMMLRLQASKNDTTKVSALNQLAAHYEEISHLMAHPKAIDTATTYAQKALVLSENRSYQDGIGQSSIILSKIAWHKQQLDKAEVYAKKAVAAYSKLNDKNKLALAQQELWNAGYLVYSKQENFEYAQKILKLYREAGNKKGEAYALVDVADTYNDLGKLELARDALLESLRISKSIGDRQTQRAYSLLAYTYYQLGDLKEAVRMAIVCDKLLEEFHDESRDAIRMYNSFFNVYLAIKDLPKAHEYLNKAYMIALKYDDEEARTSIECNMVKILVALHRDKEALGFLDRLERKYNSGALPIIKQHVFISRWIITYCNLKDYKTAARYVGKAIAISEKFAPEDFEQNYFYPPLSEYYWQTKQYVLARKYTELYAKLGEKNKNTSSLMWAHKQLFKLDSVEQKFDSAIKNLNLHRKYNDSLLNQDKNRQIAEMQVKYETDKKDKDLLLKEKNNKLLRKQGELQKTKLSQANLFKNIGFVGILLLLIILSLVYRGFYSKQKSNRQLQAQKAVIDEKNTALQKLADEREWLLREIHHRVKNNLQIVMSLLSTQSHYLTDKAAMLAISSSQHRIHSMSLIHKKLYQSDNLVAIHMPTYINELIEYFRISFDTGQRIRFNSEVEDINLDIAQAVPVGLILNEAITNAIKHAFPNGGDGEVSIKMFRDGALNCRLIIADNGIGCVPQSQIGDSLGMKLINGLAGDINGTVTAYGSSGYRIELAFPIEESTLEKFEEKQIV